MVRVTQKELEKIRKQFSNVSSVSTRHHIYVEHRRDIIAWLARYRRKH